MNGRCEQVQNRTAIADQFSITVLEKSIKSLADSNRNIYIGIADHAYADVATNLYLTSFKRLSITNYLFISLNAKGCDVLDARGINCLHYIGEFQEGLTPSTCRTVGFHIKTNQRARIVVDSLRLGYNLFLVDLDIVFVEDPGPIVCAWLLDSALDNEFRGGDSRNSKLALDHWVGNQVTRTTLKYTLQY